MITLQAGETVAHVLPEVGGSIASFSIDGDAVLRPAPASASDPLAMSCFPLVPWCGRVAGGRLRELGRTLRSTRVIEGEPHAIHGHGWIAGWDVVDQADHTVELAYHHPSGSWPWEYRAFERITVEPDRLSVRLELVNLSLEPMPAGLGFHPYFERPARLTATVDGVWTSAGSLLPTGWEPAEPFRSTDLDGHITDNTYTGWDGRAVIDGPGGRIELVSDLKDLHIYTPRAHSYFCVEPVSGAPDALNHPERGVVVIEPGEAFTAALRISR